METNIKMLVFYDSTGKVYFTMSIDETPSGLERFVFDILEGYYIKNMDMTDPSDPKPVLEKKDTPMDYKAEISAIEEAVAELYEMIIAEG